MEEPGEPQESQKPEKTQEPWEQGKQRGTRGTTENRGTRRTDADYSSDATGEFKSDFCKTGCAHVCIWERLMYSCIPVRVRAVAVTLEGGEGARRGRQRALKPILTSEP